MNTRCIYLTEGECEQALVNALKEEPRRIIPGKVKTFNVIKNQIPKSQLATFAPGSTVVFVFDTDVPRTDCLKQNIELVKRLTGKVRLVTIAQVLNLEDELEHCTDVRKAQELTQSRSVKDFKSAFSKMKSAECRNALERHKLDVEKLWVTTPPDEFGFVEQEAGIIKL